MSCTFCATFNANELLSNALTVSGCTAARGIVVDVDDVVDVVDVVVVAGGTYTAGAVVVEVVDDDEVVGATVVVVVVVFVVDVVVVVVVVVVVPVLISAPALSATRLSPICDGLVPALAISPEPRRPSRPLPQHFTDASSSMAHV